MIKKIPRLAMRPQDERAATEDKELWQPSWKCFCCADAGIIAPHLAAMAIEDYDRDKDKLPRCVAPGCLADCYFDTQNLEDCLDYRVDAQTCQELDLLERESWRETVKAQQTYIVETKQLAESMRISGCSDRTDNDNREAHQRKEEVESTSHDDWIRMSRSYRGGDC